MIEGFSTIIVLELFCDELEEIFIGEFSNRVDGLTGNVIKF